MKTNHRKPLLKYDVSKNSLVKYAPMENVIIQTTRNDTLNQYGSVKLNATISSTKLDNVSIYSR